MALLLGFLCRAWRCACRGPIEAGRSPQSAEATAPDDLTAIKGVGMVTQDRLNRSGIKTYAQLAQASLEDLRAILGSRSTEARIKAWIAEARKLAREGASRAA
jgi:predicted flap endonuclease-1-like 5' DNA nuclease